MKSDDIDRHVRQQVRVEFTNGERQAGVLSRWNFDNGHAWKIGRFGGKFDASDVKLLLPAGQVDVARVKPQKEQRADPQVLEPGYVEVGDGITHSVGSDQYPGTIFGFSKTQKTVYFTDDDSKMTKGDHYGPSHEQEFEFVTRTPYLRCLSHEVDFRGADDVILALREHKTCATNTNARTARWSEKRERYLIGHRSLSAGRRSYRDPSF